MSFDVELGLIGGQHINERTHTNADDVVVKSDVIIVFESYKKDDGVERNLKSVYERNQIAYFRIEGDKGAEPIKSSS